MEPKILVVDDDDEVRDMLCGFLNSQEYLVDEANSFSSACKLVDSDDYDIILTDKNYPGINGNLEGGMDLLRYIRTVGLTAEVIIITGHASLKTAVNAMKLGAFDYIEKPFSTDELHKKLNRLTEYKRFLNPDAMLELYRSIRHATFTLVENKPSISESELINQLVDLNVAMDSLFKVFKESEKIMLTLRESLAKISNISEELLSDGLNDGAEDLLKNIRCLANTNV